MSSRKRFRARRRSGISNLIGAIFFVLIVALVITALTAVFVGSSSYIAGIHTDNEQSLDAVNSQVLVKNTSFGGELATSVSPNPASVGVSDSNPQEPLLPVSNMNFSSGMQGWYVSESYPNLIDGATVTNALQSNGSEYIEQAPVGSYLGLSTTQSDNPETFVLAVTNNALPGSHDAITKITLLVDTYFDSVSTVTCPACAGWTIAPPVGNNITLTGPAVAGIQPGDTVTITWSADVPFDAGAYYHTAIVYWTQGIPVPMNYYDYGVATVETIIASPLPFPNPSAPLVPINPRTSGVNPGGLIAGYDSDAVNTTVSSGGPGSVFVNFEPSFSGQSMPSGQQLSGVVTLSTPFTLSQSEVCDLAVAFTGPPCGSTVCAGCTMTGSVASSLDEALSVPNSLVYYHLILVNPDGSAFVMNQGGTNPTIVNHFGPTGWIQNDFTVPTSGPGAPAAGFWTPGTYTFELVVNMTMPSGQPSEILMHFDDLGLALNLAPSGGSVSAYGSQIIPMYLGQPGTSTSASPTVLTDAGANWVPNEWVGDTLTYTTGFAAGESQMIISNTATTITTGTFLPAPSPLGGDEFVVRATGLVQGLDLNLNMSMSAVPHATLLDTVAYVYVEDEDLVTVNNAFPAVWVQVGSVTFNGSADLQVSIPLPNAAFYVANSGELNVKVVTLSLGSENACIASTCTLYVSAYGIAQTTNTGQVVFTVSQTQGISPVHLVSVYMTGMNGYVNPETGMPVNSNGLATFSINDWVSTGSSVELSESVAGQSFAWMSGQVYVVTVTTSTGVTYSGSFVAP